MPFQTHPVHLLAAGACALFVHGAHAETVMPVVTVTGQGPLPGYAAASSAVAGKIAAPLRDIPQAVNVVTQELMRDQNALSLQDALQNVPGLGFSVGDGQRDQVMIRGFSGISDQFLDGVRDDAMYFRDLSNVERIEVLKGPAAVVYGRGSAGGLVNRVSKKPQAQPVNEVGGLLGTRGQKRVEFDAGAASADAGALLRVTGAVEDSGSFRNQYFLKRQVIAPTLTLKLAPQTSLTLAADYLQDRRLADQGVPAYRGRPLDVPIATYFGAANGSERAFVESKVASAGATLEHRFNAALALRTVLRSYHFSLDRNYTGIGKITDGAAPTLAISQTHRTRNEHGVYLQNELSQTLELGGMQHQILYGLELAQQRKDEWLVSRNNVATYSLFHPVLADLAPLPADLAPSSNNSSTFDTAALYLQDLVALGPRWKVLAGARYDRLRQRRDDRRPLNQDLTRTDGTLSPRVGAVYQPDGATAYYASLSRSFQPMADSFTFFNNSDQLQPTETVNKEIGAKFDLGRKASATVALFEMTQTNVQNADPLNPGFALAVGKQRSRGVELTLAGEIAPRWEASASYSLMKGEIVAAAPGSAFLGKEAALTPRHNANVWLKRRLDGGYYAAGGVHAEAARFASSDNAVTLPGYAVLQLGAGYASAKWDFTATLKNLLNRRYFAAAHSGANDYNMPGEPRSLLLAARYRF